MGVHAGRRIRLWPDAVSRWKGSKSFSLLIDGIMYIAKMKVQMKVHLNFWRCSALENKRLSSKIVQVYFAISML